MDLEEFRKRQSITYADEVNPFKFPEHTGITIDCIVSFTSRRNVYVSSVEKNWLEMRQSYGFESGLALHFTELRQLIDYKPGTLSKAVEERRQQWFKYFANADLTKIDLGKLHAFYTDVMTHLATMDGHFLTSGLLRATLHIGNRAYVAYAVQEPIMQIFTEHLNLLVAYLSHAYLPKANRTGLRDKPWTTKLRYDGDAALTYRGPLRLAFNQAMLMGTRQFKPELVREVIDEIRFVNKDEVGYYEKGHPDMSHIGNEIVDFAAAFIARGVYKDEFVPLAVETRQASSQAEAEELYRKLTVIEIPGYPTIEPLTILNAKTFAHPNLQGAIKLPAEPFRYTP